MPTTTTEHLLPVWSSTMLSDEHKRLIESAFSPSQATTPGGARLHPGQNVWDGHEQRGLVYVVCGSVREVVIRKETEQTWHRGRDPRVTDVLGEGCFLGLSLLKEMLEHDAPDPGRSIATERHVYYVNAQRWLQGDAAKIRFIPWNQLLPLLEIPTIRAWMHALCHTALDCTASHLHMDANPLLEVLGRPERNALLHQATRTWADRDLSPWRQAGDRCEDVHLLLAGQAELVLPGEPGTPDRVIALLSPGDLISAQYVVHNDEIDDEPMSTLHDHLRRRMHIYLSQDAEMLSWGRAAMRDVLTRCPAAWQRMITFVQPVIVDAMAGHARVTCVVNSKTSWGAPSDATVMAAGTALALSRTAGGGRRVILVDTSDGLGIARAYGVTLELSAPAVTPAVQFEHLVEDDRTPGYRSMVLHTSHHQHGAYHERIDAPGGLEIWVPDSPHDVVVLVDLVRAMHDVSDVVVYLPHTTLCMPDDFAVVRNNEDPPKVVPGSPLLAHVALDAMRVLPYTTLWLSTDADGWYRHTDEAPDRLIRVDRLTDELVRNARQRAHAFMGTSMHDESDDRPGNRTHGSMTVPLAAQDFADAAAGGLIALVDGPDPCPRSADPNPVGAACWRAARMVRRKTVGVALGGGGTWGASHIAILRALHDHNVPVDYVSGTSFGALMGGIFAGGGHPALDHFLHLSAFPRSLASRVTPDWLRGMVPAPVRALRNEQKAVSNPVAGALRHAMLGRPSELDKLVNDIIIDAEGTLYDPKPHLGLPTPVLRETQVPFLAVASSLTEQTQYVPYHFPLGMAVRAASSLPPGFPGFWFKGAKFVDGAALANVPCGALREQGADFVIAINVVGAQKVTRRPPLRPRVGTVFERVTDAVKTGWLTLWKAGTQQAENYADVLVDVHINGIGLASTWRAPEIVKALEASMGTLGADVHAAWESFDTPAGLLDRFNLEYDAEG